MTFASTSCRQSASRSTSACGTLRCRQVASSHSEARRTSAPVAPIVSSSTCDNADRSVHAARSGDSCPFGIGGVPENRDQFVDAGRFEAHYDCRAVVDDQHHFAPALLDCLGADDERAYADRGQEFDGSQVDDHAFLRRGGQLHELGSDRVGPRHVETAGDHYSAEVFANVFIADGHDESYSSLLVRKQRARKYDICASAVLRHLRVRNGSTRIWTYNPLES